ncbi:MAG: class II aldolase/adducin family protein [archaeon]|nr:class II aldolase/adducin family protein [archaeon]
MALDPKEEEKRRKQEEKLNKLYEECRNTVFEGAKKIYEKGLVEFGEGNVSFRVKKKDEFFITPSQNDYANFSKEEIAHINFEGIPQSERGRKASSEYLLHTAIYRSRKKTMCVIHNHSKYASMLAVAGKSLPTIIEEMAFLLGGDVPCTEFGESGSEALGEVVITAMNEAKTNAVIVKNHGVVVCGKDLTSTVRAAMLVEKMAQIYIGSLSLGSVQGLPSNQLEKWIGLFNGMNSTVPKKPK